MKGALRWLAILGSSLIGLIALAILVVLAVSQSIIGASYKARAESLATPTAAQIADAPRQARLLGCVTCHGEGLGGNLVADVPPILRIHAPNLTTLAARASDQQLAAAIRQGIGVDGRPLFVMPSPQYSRLTDGELAALITFIRGKRRVEGREEGVSFYSVGRFALASGRMRPQPARVEDYRTQAPIDLGPAHAAGRRLADKYCIECHGAALLGAVADDGTKTPDLRIVAAYDPVQFRALLRTGVPPSGRDLGLMKLVAREDFSHFTDAEIETLRSYLEARAKRLGD